MHRVVLDTNVLVSAFLFYDRGGLPAELLQNAREQRFTLIASEPLLDEFDGSHPRCADAGSVRLHPRGRCCVPTLLETQAGALGLNGVVGDPRPTV